MLRCRDGSLYTGCTNDLAGRLERHRAGRGARYTRSRLPVRLVFSEPAQDRSAALRREAALKQLTRAEKLELLASSRLKPPSPGGADEAGLRPASSRLKPATRRRRARSGGARRPHPPR
jgi:putative endonuclease